jgi:hypothetical protein
MGLIIVHQKHRSSGLDNKITRASKTELDLAVKVVSMSNEGELEGMCVNFHKVRPKDICKTMILCIFESYANLERMK